jgi:TorA maturation chaperone TorD
VYEPEDHAGSLCQAMAALILAPDDYAAKEQRQFFTRHIGSWMSEFFSDLAEAKQAVFYRSVAEFSQTFMRIEKHYFSMEV